jgi:hypothetical protein
MYKTIEFKQSTPDSIPGANPWTTHAKSSYKDLILRPEFAARRFQFPLGATWLRIVPAMKESEKESCLFVHALQYQGGDTVTRGRFLRMPAACSTAPTAGL